MVFLNSIRQKVLFCAGVGLLGFFVATVSTYYSNDRLTSNLGNLREVTFPLSMQGEEARNLFAQQTSLYEDAFLLADEDSLAEGDALSEPIQNLFAEMLQVMEGANESLMPIYQQLTKLQKSYSRYSILASSNYALLVDGADIVELQNEIRKIGKMQQDTATELSQLKDDLVLAVEGDISSGETAANSNSRLIIILFLAFGFLSIVIVNIAAARLLVHPIRLVQGQSARLAEGDFAAIDKGESDAGGEIGELVSTIRKMAGNLKAMISDITTSSNALGTVSKSLQETSVRVASSAQNQADAVDHTSSAVARIGASVEQVSQQMERVSATSEEITTSILEQSASTEEIAHNIDDLSSSAEHVNSSIAQIASNISQISESVGVLKGESDVTASSVAEMETSIRQVMQGAKDTTEIASSVQTDAEAGHKAVSESMSGMQRIKSSSQVAAESIRSFSEKAENIGSILSVINNLADETNLLALNAAIIAAQAGEHGRGFAVVADQIKELADQTSLSTREIVEIIDGVKDESRNAVSAIVETEKSITEGEALSTQSGEMLQKIVDGIRQVVNEMDRISSATSEQVHGSGLIRTSTDKVSDMVHQIVTAIDEQEKGSNTIMQASDRVNDLVGQINISIHEQSQAGRAVASGMQDVNSMIQKVFTACEEQLDESRQITTAVDSIKVSAQESLDSTKVVNDATGSLEEQVNLLHKAVGLFNLEGDISPSKSEG